MGNRGDLGGSDLVCLSDRVRDGCRRTQSAGGRAPGIDVLTRGVVSISSDDEVLMVLQIDGQFEVELKAGGYRLTATFGNGIGHVAVFESPRLSTP